MLMGGLGAVAHATRLGRDGRDFIYTLLEPGAAGAAVLEDFPAPDHATALERAREAMEGGAFELWFGDELVAREG